MLRSYKYRIYPNKEQVIKIEQTIGCCRLVYNLALQVKITAYKDAGINLSAYDIKKELPSLKDAYPWLKDVDSQSLQQSIINIEKAFNNFYNGFGYPKFKSKHGKQSFQCPNNTKRVDWKNNTLTIPKISDIPIKLSRKFEGKINTITVSKTPTGKYFASILVDNGIELPKLKPITKEGTIGVDTGIKSFVVSSDGRTFEANRKLRDNLKRLQCLQRRASRKKKGGNNRKKANLKVALLHEKITNQRLDCIHKITHELTSDSQVNCICVEDFNVSGILKNHKLAQAMSDVSLGKFYEINAYKCAWNGINLIKINRFAPSSKRCSICGSINKELTLADREWECKNCNTLHDRDGNASENIKWYGLETIFKNNAPEGIWDEPVELLALAGAEKQEKYCTKEKELQTI